MLQGGYSGYRLYTFREKVTEWERITVNLYVIEAYSYIKHNSGLGIDSDRSCFLFGQREISQKCPTYSLKMVGDELDVIKNVPIGCKSMKTKMLGYPKVCHYLCDN